MVTPKEVEIPLKEEERVNRPPREEAGSLNSGYWIS